MKVLDGKNFKVHLFQPLEFVKSSTDNIVYFLILKVIMPFVAKLRIWKDRKKKNTLSCHQEIVVVNIFRRFLTLISYIFHIYIYIKF